MNCTLMASIAFAQVALVQIVNAQETKQEDEKKFDASTLIGSWKITKGMKGGEESAADALPESIIVSEDDFTMPVGDDQSFVMGYELDTSKSPMEIDFEIKEGPVPEGKAVGILKVEDGKVYLCYNAMGAERPEDFESTSDNGFFMFVMEKAGWEAADLIGEWTYESGVRGGVESPDERLAGVVTITEDTFTLPAGGTDFVMSYQLAKDESPCHIDLEIEEGPVPEGSAKGIIAMKDGKIMLCYDAMGGDRPEDFESTEENGYFYFVLSKGEDFK